MFVLVLIILILFPDAAQKGALEGLEIAFKTVIPSVLPFSVVSCALVYSGVIEKIGRALFPLAKLMRINPCGTAALLAGLLGGYPTGCKMVCDMHKEGLIDKQESEKMLGYVNNGGLVFALSVCGEALFHSKRTGLLIFCISGASALVAAVILGRSDECKLIAAKKEKLPFMAVLGKSIASGGGVILNIASSFVVFYALSNALGLYKVPLLEGCVEMTKGIMHAGEVENLPLAAFFFTLGGVGVFAQSAAICSEHNLSLRGYVKGKVLSAAIAFIITYLFSGEAFIGKDIALLSLLAALAVIASLRIIKKLYAKA